MAEGTGEWRPTWPVWLDQALAMLGRDLATFEAAYSLGYHTGYDVGRAHAEAAEAASWAPVARSVRERANSTGYEQLVALRSEPVSGPCGARACRGCSVCVRAAAVRRNRERWGTDDYPGGYVRYSRPGAA